MAGKSKSARSRSGKTSKRKSARAAGKKSKRAPAKKSKRSSKASNRSSRKSGRRTHPAMLSKNVKEMKLLLLERRQAILSEMQHSLRSYQSGASHAKGDSSDLAAEALDSDTAMQLAEGESSELAQIDAALQSMAEGNYGLCEPCGEQIPWARLKALPYATLCVKCKEKQEILDRGLGAAAGWNAVGNLEELGQD